MISRSEPRSRRRVPLVLVPWIVYLGVTLVAPALNGAARSEAFAEHAIITLGISGAMTMLWLAAGRRPPRRRLDSTREVAPNGALGHRDTLAALNCSGDECSRDF